MAQQAQDTFVVTLPDGRTRRVAKGEVLADRDELVKLDQKGSGVLFKPLDLGEDEKPPPKSAAKAEAKAPPVKAEPKAAPVKGGA